MNRGNRRTTKEGDSDLKFQNFSLSKNRSWPRINTVTGQYQTIREPLLDWERNFSTVRDEAEGCRDEDYEDPELHMAQMWQTMRILPTQPLKESDYADTRYFIDTPLSFYTNNSVAMDGQAWKTRMGLKEAMFFPKKEGFEGLKGKLPSWLIIPCGGMIGLWVNSLQCGETHCQGLQKPTWKRDGRILSDARENLANLTKDTQTPREYARNCGSEGDHPMRENKGRIPLPPPRPPVTLPKRYQPLPPEPESSRPSLPLRHTIPVPECPRQPSQINLKNLSEVLGQEKVPQPQMKSASSQPSQKQHTPEIPLVATSSSWMVGHQAVQNRGRSLVAHTERMQFHSPQRWQSPARPCPAENPPSCRNTTWRKAFPIHVDGKDTLHGEWYIGEHSRQAVEEALMKENKDGTFLVRDCSKKSRAEPYVLAVFYGNKVYNVKIRFLERSLQFALGTGLRGDEKFNSVEAIIEHYKHSPIILIDGKDKTGFHREQCYLTQPLPFRRHFSPR